MTSTSDPHTNTTMPGNNVHVSKHPVLFHKVSSNGRQNPLDSMGWDGMERGVDKCVRRDEMGDDYNISDFLFSLFLSPFSLIDDIGH